MVTGILVRSVVRSAGLAALGVALVAACAGQTRETGGETNWLVPCEADGDCSGEASCHCGVCTVTCTADTPCGDGRGCAGSGSAAFGAACPGGNETGVCLESCASSGCGSGRTCTAGLCVPGSTEDAGSDAPTSDSSPREATAPPPDGPAPLEAGDAVVDASDGCVSRPILGTPHCVRARCDRSGCELCSGSTPSATQGPVPCGDDTCDPTCHRVAKRVAPGNELDGTVLQVDATFVSECPSGQVGSWSLLTFGASTPGATSIRILLDADPMLDGGPNRAPFELTVGPGGLPDDCSLLGPAGCPVNLATVLGNASTDRVLHIALERIGSGDELPTIEWVEARYGCITDPFLGYCELGGRRWANGAQNIPAGCTTAVCSGGVASSPPIACTQCAVVSDCEGAGDYCDRTAACGSPTGTCAYMPPADCSDEGPAVCGCDGLTYANACSALVAGASIAYPAPCGTVNGCWEGEILHFEGVGDCLCEGGKPGRCVGAR